MKQIVISEIQIIPVKPNGGLVSFATCVINNQFYIGNIAIHSSPSSIDGFRIVFPNKKLSSGHAVPCFHPISKEAGEAVSSAIIKKYIELMKNFQNAK